MQVVVVVGVWVQGPLSQLTRRFADGTHQLPAAAHIRLLLVIALFIDDALF